MGHCSDQPALAREISFRDGIALVIGNVIGSGIFLVAGPIAGQLRPFSSVILVWALGGLLSLFGALSLGELAALFPRAGGLYIYLLEAYNRPLAFLYGWALFSIIQSGTIATLGSAFSLYLASLVPLSQLAQHFVSIACILLLSAVNCVGVKHGKWFQNISTLCKLGGIGVLFFALFHGGHRILLRESAHSKEIFSPPLASFGIALVAVLWAYEGWHTVSFVASEFRNPKRDLPRCLVIGIAICICIYITLNCGYYSVLSYTALRETNHAAATAMTFAYGYKAAVFVSVVILISVLGGLNGNIMTGPRVYYAMAGDRLFFSPFRGVNKRFHTPVIAIIAQAIWASFLVTVGSFKQLFTSVVFTEWIFFGLAVAAVVVLRRRNPNRTRSFRAPAYPWIQAVFVLASMGIAVSTIYLDPEHAAIGIALVLVGLPLYIVFL
jgi:basic amino acid/polyamine antiporter, APA family